MILHISKSQFALVEYRTGGYRPPKYTPINGKLFAGSIVPSSPTGYIPAIESCLSRTARCSALHSQTSAREKSLIQSFDIICLCRYWLKCSSSVIHNKSLLTPAIANCIITFFGLTSVMLFNDNGSVIVAPQSTVNCQSS